MGAIQVIAVILLALLIGGLFYYGLNSRGPWGSFWTFLLIVFFGMWVAAIWIEPVGPVWYGTAFLDLLFVGLLFAVLLAAATPRPPSRPKSNRSAEAEVRREAAAGTVAIGFFFWILLFLFFIAVAIGLAI